MFYSLIENKRNEWLSASDAEVKIEAKTNHATINGHKTQTFWDATISVDKDDSPTTHRPLRLKFRNIFGDETVYVL